MLLRLGKRSCGVGLERGGEAGPWGRRVPQTPQRGFAAEASPSLERWAEMLLDEARRRLPEQAERIAVRLSRAEVDGAERASLEGSGRVYAHLLVGSSAALPRWTRIAALEGPHWPAGWLAAVARELSGWQCPRMQPTSDLPLLVDCFAAADLIRREASRWLRGAAQEGARVLAEGLNLVEERGNLVVADGRLMPIDAPVVRIGWRDDARPAWRRLELDSAKPCEGAGFPRAAVVATRVVIVGSIVFGAGHVLEDSRPVASWGPARLESASRLLTSIDRVIPPAIVDATGSEIATPALLLKTDRV